jgi:hypothetical protein
MFERVVSFALLVFILYHLGIRYLLVFFCYATDYVLAAFCYLILSCLLQLFAKLLKFKEEFRVDSVEVLAIRPEEIIVCHFAVDSSCSWSCVLVLVLVVVVLLVVVVVLLTLTLTLTLTLILTTLIPLCTFTHIQFRNAEVVAIPEDDPSGV